MKCWRTIQIQMPRVATELKHVVMHLRSGCLPEPGLLDDQHCRYVSLLDWLMMMGAIRGA